MKSPLVLSLLSSIGLFLGCSTSGSKFIGIENYENGKSPVYIYRGNISCGVFDPTFIQVNGHEIGKLYNQGYTYAMLQEGKHLVTASTTSITSKHAGTVSPENRLYAGVKTIEVKKDTEIYLKYDVTCKGGILPVVRPDNDLQVVDKEKALPQIRETKLGLIK